MRNLIFSLLVVATTTSIYAQEKPIRVGLKFGVPMIVGLNLEYVTPVAGGRLAPSVDLSRFSISLGDAESTFSYVEVGSNIYLKDTGRGTYANLSYGLVSWTGEYTNSSLGNAEVELNLSRINLKLGAKLGKGFYFRPEVGFAIGFGSDELEVEYTDSDGNRTTTTEDVPGILNGGFVLNLGFGVAF